MKREQPNSMRKAALAAAVVTALGTGGMADTARATVYDLSFTGVFTMLDPTGVALQNTSLPYSGDSTWGYGNRTQISGTMHFDSATGLGSGTIVPFQFFNGNTSLPATATGITLQAIGNGTCVNNDPAQGCQAGTLILGNMLFNWNGNNGIPVSIVLDAAGFFGAGPYSLNQVISGTGALPASNGIKKGAFPIGPAPVATTTWNTTLVGAACTGTSGSFVGVSCQNRNPSGGLPLISDLIGGSPMVAGPFQGFNANFDVISMTVTCIDNICGPSQITNTSPTNGATNVDTAATVSITFTQPMQASTVAAPGTFTLSGDGGVTFITGTMSPTSGTATNFTFTPSNPLAFSTTYTANISTGALDTLNNPATNAPFTWTFTTKAPPPPPVASSCTASTAVPQGSNFTMLTPTGIPFGGTNDVVYSWNGTFNTAVSGAGSTNFNMTIASALPQLFFGFKWTAHHIRVFGPGTYTFNTDCTTAQLEAGTCTANIDPSKNLTMTVGAGQIGAHMLFDWNTSTNIDVVNVWNQNAVWSDPDGVNVPKNNLWVGDRWAGPAGVTVNPSTTWALISTDNDGNGINGVSMIDGPFIGYNANFNLGPTNSCLLAAPTLSTASEVGKVSGGCSLSSFRVKPSERADWWLLAGFVTWLGVVRRRNKRQHQA